MDAVFAVVPFTDVRHPAIGLGTIVAAVKRAGFSARVEYLSLKLAAWLGRPLYEWISDLTDPLLVDTTMPSVSLVGDWFFAGLAFPGQTPPDGEYLAKFVAPDRGGETRMKGLVEARNRYADQFVDYAAERILRHRPKVVGLSSTFHQTCCSLAIAKRIKASPDPPAIIFGGANCEGEMGLQMIRSFPWIDYVCTGEGDRVTVEFLERYVREGNPEPPEGILRRGFTDELRTPKPTEALDTLPVPDYGDYFDELAVSGLDDVEPILHIETARGCWWGQKHHCTFCGLNGAGMAYRSKSPARVLAELAELSDTYGPKRVDSVDNILDTRYIQTLFPELIRRGSDLTLFFEVKSNLRYDQLKTLYAGGVRAVQPGIENFSNSVLRTMRKGCTGLQNVQLLRWCDELGIFPVWNMLYGFPGEDPDEYARMAELIPLLTHLQPPAFCIRVRMDRFSPLYNEAAAFGLENVRPMEAYSWVYPLPESELRNLAYFFEFNYGDGRVPGDYARPVTRAIEEWSANAKSSTARLDAFGVDDVAIVVDTRECAVKRQHLITGVAAHVLRECDTAAKFSHVARRLGVLEAEVAGIVKMLINLKLMIEMEDQVLSLPVFRERSAASRTAEPESLFVLTGASRSAD